MADNKFENIPEKFHDIELQQVLSPAGLEPVAMLYEEAFPENERRSRQGLLAQLETEWCKVNRIVVSGTFAGLCILWSFDEFVFVEHLAIVTEMRGKKIGEGVLAALRAGNPKPLLLETEPPNDEWSIRRIDFYLRNGFHMLDYPYQQPAYDFVSPDLTLKLMCTQCSPDKELIRNWIARVHRRVYGRGN